MKYAVITENEVTRTGIQYDDVVGDHYSFPQLYKKILTVGTIVVYYKSRHKKQQVVNSISKTLEPHYFGVARIVEVMENYQNSGLLRATIQDFKLFDKSVSFKKPGGGHYEKDSTKSDRAKWRNGVREIDENVFSQIMSAVGLNVTGNLELSKVSIDYPDPDYTTEVQSTEGKPKCVYSTRYERDRTIRTKVLKLKGYTCCVCGTNFEKLYGEVGQGFIHVHHNKPLYQGERASCDIERDFDIVCPNCHAMIHRRKNECLSVEQLREILVTKNK